MTFSRLAVAAVAAMAWFTLFLPVAGRVSQVHAVNITYTNDTGEPAGHFVLIISTLTVPATIVTQPESCGPAERFGGFEYVEFIWPAPCIGPGESIVLDTIDPTPYIVVTHSFASNPPVVLAVNDKSFVADTLVIDIAPTFGISGALLIENAPGCPEPMFEEQASVQLSLVWSSPCVDPGEQVAVHVAGGGAGGFNVGNLPYQFVATLGDVNCDGAVTIVDAQLIAQLILGRVGELPCPSRADVDEDGGVFITDAQLIAQLVAGRIQSLPPS